ncbi:hypothetical protein D3C74_398330 [compost metagenome]
MLKTHLLLGLRRCILLVLLQKLNEHSQMVGMALDLLIADLVNCGVLGAAGGSRQLLNQQILIGDGIGNIFQFFSGKWLHLRRLHIHCSLLQNGSSSFSMRRMKAKYVLICTTPYL